MLSLIYDRNTSDEFAEYPYNTIIIYLKYMFFHLDLSPVKVVSLQGSGPAQLSLHISRPFLGFVELNLS